MEAALPRWIATSMFWQRNAVARGSPIFLESRAPISDAKDQALEPHVPKVSTAKGTNMWFCWSSAYFADFLDLESEAATPVAKEVWWTRDGATVSGHVKSQTSIRPLDQGIIVTPSGLLPSLLSIPVGSRVTGVSALRKDRAMMSFASESLRKRPELF